MSDAAHSRDRAIEEIYADDFYHHINTGDTKIHAKRMRGHYRLLKWMASSVWLIFFLGPYLRWGDRQAVLFNIPDRQFHIFGITILPQDIWMLSLTLLFFAILLAAATSVAGRVYCGFFCFQTIWTDVYTSIEEWLEGNPTKRRKLDESPLTLRKLRIRITKWTLWLVIAFLTGVSFVAWFTDAPQLWKDLLTFGASTTATFVVLLFTAGTFILAGFLREQVCFWLCPYARIQGVMYDHDTILPTYDRDRGEPRGRLKRGEAAGEDGRGDCIDCGQCLAVCPTGVDIRMGQQEGCITCALCIDACNTVMDKIERPRGLIRYASLTEMQGEKSIRFYQRPRVLVYFAIIALSFSGILYGLTHLGDIELKVLHERQPLFVLQSDGAIQNKFDLKILNKTSEDIHVNVTVEGDIPLQLMGADRPLLARPGGTSSHSVFVRVPRDALPGERQAIRFRIVDSEKPEISAVYESAFFGPAR